MLCIEDSSSSCFLLQFPSEWIISVVGVKPLHMDKCVRLSNWNR